MIKTLSPIFSSASGIKCKKAPPIKAPADKATNPKVIFLRVFSLRAKVITPMNEIRLIRNVPNNIKISGFIMLI